MDKRVQIIVAPSGERLAVLPEEDYLMLLAPSEDDEGEVKPEFLEELRRRRHEIAEGGAVVQFDGLRGRSAEGARADSRACGASPDARDSCSFPVYAVSRVEPACRTGMVRAGNSRNS
jgi:hypothetical protein